MKTKNSSTKRLLGFVFKEYKFHIIVVVLGILGSALAMVRGTLFLQTLIDDYITPLVLSSDPDFAPLANAIMKIAAIYGVGVICAYVYNRVTVNVSQGTMKKLRQRLFDHMETLPLGYFDTHAHGDIMSVYTNDIDTLRQFLSQSFPQLLNSIISIISVLVAMIMLNVPLTIATLVMVCIMTVVSRKTAHISGRYFQQQQKYLGRLNGFIEEMIGGQKVVKVFCYEDRSVRRFKRVNERLRTSADKANTYGNILMPVVMQLGNVSYVLCAVLGGVMALNGFGGVTIGVLVSFLTLNKSFNQPFGQISQQLNSVVMAMAGADRIYSLLDEVPEPDEGRVTLVNVGEKDGVLGESEKTTGRWAWKLVDKETGKAQYRPMKGKVVFENVYFGYTPEKTVLHNINMFAKEGQKIAFVGSTGAGKTTITNLINRFYDIQSGTITYDDIDIMKIKKDDLRRSLGIVLQDTNLFTGTVMENIRYGKLDATDEECIAAAKLANAHSFIKTLPHGYDTVITNNAGSLSQGQKQLLTIARAAVANPPVLILDEATSSIDTHTEKLVQDGMDKLMAGRTTFVIAHRLSTIQNANCIMVMENGSIIERGTHEELIEQKGRYYKLYTGKSA